MKRASLLLLPAAVLGASYHDVISSLVIRWWTDPDYSHGFFVPLFSLIFLWEKRASFTADGLRSSWAGLPVMLLAAVLRALGHLLLSPYLGYVSLLVMLGGLVLLCCGKRVVRQAWFPMSFLVLMLPLPRLVYESVALPLQQFSAIFASAVLEGLRVPVLREGNVIHFAGKTLEVVQACSGIRLLTGFAAMSIVVAHLQRKPLWHKGVLVASTIPVAVAANALRVTGTGILYYTSGRGSAEGFFHTFSGWLLFVLALGALLLESYLLSRAAAFARARWKGGSG